MQSREIMSELISILLKYFPSDRPFLLMLKKPRKYFIMNYYENEL